MNAPTVYMAGRVARMKLASKLMGINTWRNARARGKTVGAVTSGRFKGSEREYISGRPPETDGAMQYKHASSRKS